MEMHKLRKNILAVLILLFAVPISLSAQAARQEERSRAPAPYQTSAGPRLSQKQFLTKYADVLKKNRRLEAYVKANPGASFVTIKGPLREGRNLVKSEADNAVLSDLRLPKGRESRTVVKSGADNAVIIRAGDQIRIGRVPTGNDPGAEPSAFIACLIFGPAAVACVVGLTIFFVLQT